MSAPTDQQTIAELARHNQELSLALSAVERRAKEAEQETERVKANHVTVTEEAQRRHDALAPLLAEVDALKSENKILQRTAELQLALVTATADVVDAARLAAAEFRGEPPDELGLAVRLTRLSKTLAALDQASPREPA